jgi:REP element-mobilizing transposase RayT
MPYINSPFEGLKLHFAQLSKYLRAILCKEAKGMFINLYNMKEDGINNVKGSRDEFHTLLSIIVLFNIVLFASPFKDLRPQANTSKKEVRRSRLINFCCLVFFAMKQLKTSDQH